LPGVARRVLLAGSDETLLLRAFTSAATATKVWCLAPAGSAAAAALRRSRRCLGVVEAPAGPDGFARADVEAAVASVGASHLAPVALPDAALVGTGEGWPCATYPGVDDDVRRCLHDKWAFAALVERAGVAAPPTALAGSAEEARSIAAGHGFEVVLKPPAEAGGRGVFVCRREAEVDAAIAAWPAWPRLVQRFVPGDDRDVSVLARDGRVVAAAVQDRFLRHGLRFVDDPEALALAARLVEATGFSGLAHLDMRRRPDGGVEVIECNPRMYATMHLAALAGVEFVSLGLDAADGWTPADPVVAEPGVVVPPRGMRSAWRVRRAWTGPTLRAALGVLRDPRFALSRGAAADWGTATQGDPGPPKANARSDRAAGGAI
jgi:hypothetical protein